MFQRVEKSFSILSLFIVGEYTKKGEKHDAFQIQFL
jgi:hypothetical protein